MLRVAHVLRSTETHPDVLFFIGSNSNWYYIPISILFGCIILYLLDIEKQDSDKIILNKNSHKCREPDINNPYMNVLVTQNDILKPACNDNETLSKSKNFYKFIDMFVK